MTFEDLDLSNQLQYAIEDLGFENPTPIQEQAFSVVRSGKDVVGIAIPTTSLPDRTTENACS